MTMHNTTAPTTLNGISLAAFAEAGATLTSQPQLAKVAFRVKTAWQGAVRTRSEIESYELGGQSISHRHTIHTDEPQELLGGDSAANPQDLLLAALNACMTVGFVGGATKAGVTLTRLEIESELDFDLRGAFGLDPTIPPGARTMRYTIRVSGDGTKAQFEEIHREVMANSPNRFHLTQPITLESKVIVL